ncbi:MAG: hypothetical protein ACO1SX_10340 [Actinomycetota bacterium]
MTAKDRRQRMYQQIGQAKQADPQVIVRRANAADIIARQAFRSSRIEGCKVDLDQLRETAGAIAKTRK